MAQDTIIVAPVQDRRRAAMLCENTALELLPDGPAGQRHFKIKSAEHSERRQGANLLLRHRYAWRGYGAVALPADQTSRRITLAALEEDVTIGTVTVVMDGAQGLAAESAFASEIDGLRTQGLRLCEFTKLAIDPIAGTQRVLAALFHVAYIVAHRMRGHDTLVMEVNPRHVRYYQRMLGARVLGEQRLNRSVNAPAVLLTIPFAYIRQQIGTFGGHPEAAAQERSLYPFAFTPREELQMIERMMAAHPPASTAVN